MDVLIELSGEHETLPHAEWDGALAGEGLHLRATKQAQRLVVGKLLDASGAAASRDAFLAVLDRLAMAHRASVLWASAPVDLDAAVRIAAKHPLPPKSTFAVSADRIEDLSRGTDPDKRLRSKQVEQALGEVWSQTNKVKLDDPTLLVRAAMHHDDLHIGEQVWENDRSEFEWRAPKRRPHFSPVSGHPRLMRAVVNLAAVPRGGTVYDPVCGTGGLLLEAGLIGHKVLGSDIDPEMVQGSETNLEHFGVDAELLFQCDVREASERVPAIVDAGRLDAIVADLPYGQSASTRGAGPEQVARWTMEAAVALLGPGRRAVLGLGDAELLTHVPKGLTLVAQHEVKAHKSRTRTYAVFVRSDAAS